MIRNVKYVLFLAASSKHIYVIFSSNHLSGGFLHFYFVMLICWIYGPVLEIFTYLWKNFVFILTLGQWHFTIQCIRK